MIVFANQRTYNHWLSIYFWQKMRITHGEMILATMLEF